MAQKSRIVHLMGTIIELKIVHENAELILDSLVDRLHLYERRFSPNDAKSELMEINLNAGIKAVTVHPELFSLIQLGKKHSLADKSRLNIAIGPLVQTWRIGFKDARVPDPAEIKKMLQLTDPSQIILNQQDHSVYLSKTEMLIDLGSLAKGFIADRLLDYLKNVGVASALINLGGNIIVYGPALQHEDLNWRIGIRDPAAAKEQTKLVIPVRDRSIVTSGIYERTLIENGQSYHHILDRDTGYPIETPIASLTIISKYSVDGEIWTTRLFGAPPAEIMDTIDHLPEIEGLLILQNGQIMYSKGLANKKLMVS